MKPYVKVLLIIAAALFTLGVVCLTVLAAVGGFENLGSLDYASYENVNKALPLAPDADIEITLETENLNIVVSENDYATLEYYESKYGTHECQSSESSLDFRFVAPPFSFGLLFRFDLTDHPVTLSLPKNFAGEIKVKSTTGRVNVQNFSSLELLDIEVTTGNIKLEGSSAGKINIKSSTGKIEAENITSESELSLTSTTGDIVLKNATAYGITTSSSTGSQRLTNITSAVGKHSTTTGDIFLSSIDSDNITVTASTGNIHGTLALSKSDYEIISSTSTGRNNLPNEYSSKDATRKLLAKTSTGDIHITFDDN